MAIQTVTSANLAEYVASRPEASKLTSPQAIADAVTPKGDAPTPGNPVITAGEEKLEGTPDPGAQPDPKDKPKKKSSVQERIDELVKERHELDEAFQSEYEQRLRLEGELNAFKSREQKPPEKPKDEIGPEPQPESYTDQKLFLKEWGEWQRKTARAEFAAEQAKQRAEEQQRANEAAMAVKVAKAKEDFPDFEQVALEASKRTPVVPQYIKNSFEASEWGAHIAYVLMKDPAEQRRIFSLPPEAAVMELGVIAKGFADKAKPQTSTSNVTPVVTTPEPKQAPPPIARLGESAGIAPVDLSQPLEFKDYKPIRMAQLRAQRAAGRRR